MFLGHQQGLSARNPSNSKSLIGSHFQVGEFTTHFRTYFIGDWDVRWGYGILTHCHMSSGSSVRFFGVTNKVFQLGLFLTIFFGWEGSPTKIDVLEKVGTHILTSLLEGPSKGNHSQTQEKNRWLLRQYKLRSTGTGMTSTGGGAQLLVCLRIVCRTQSKGAGGLLKAKGGPRTRPTKGLVFL